MLMQEPTELAVDHHAHGGWMLKVNEATPGGYRLGANLRCGLTFERPPFGDVLEDS